MNEACVTATDFRVHLTELANSVAEQGQRIVMVRHGYPMVALVNQEDLDFLRKHKPLSDGAPARPERLPHPETIETGELERLYAETKGRTDADGLNWREKAWLTLKLRTGRPPAEPLFSHLDTS
jgi:antitoxin (DNA-binding transcriptional repressor) of toxin-antitoxin stability system